MPELGPLGSVRGDRVTRYLPRYSMAKVTGISTSLPKYNVATAMTKKVIADAALGAMAFAIGFRATTPSGRLSDMSSPYLY